VEANRGVSVELGDPGSSDLVARLANVLHAEEEL
jgi:hypothetical protein